MLTHSSLTGSGRTEKVLEHMWAKEIAYNHHNPPDVRSLAIHLTSDRALGMDSAVRSLLASSSRANLHFNNFKSLSLGKAKLRLWAWFFHTAGWPQRRKRGWDFMIHAKVTVSWNDPLNHDPDMDPESAKGWVFQQPGCSVCYSYPDLDSSTSRGSMEYSEHWLRQSSSKREIPLH